MGGGTAVRLVWLAHGRTTDGGRDPVFGATSSLLARQLGRPRGSSNYRVARLNDARAGAGPHGERVPGAVDAVVSWSAGPEPACAETAERMGVRAAPVPELASFDPGGWRGRRLSELMAAEPAAFGSWLRDPHAAPPGGESLAALVNRVGCWVDARGWPAGRHGLIVTAVVARAAAVHALGGDPQAMLRLDVAPGARVVTTRSGAFWRLSIGPAAGVDVIA